MIKLFRPSLIKLKARDGFLIVSLCWLVASLIGAFPLWFSGAIPNYIDAFLRPVRDFLPQAPPFSLILRRCQNPCCFGVPSPIGWAAWGLLSLPWPCCRPSESAVSSSPAQRLPAQPWTKLPPRFSDTARRLYLVYLFFTILETLLLLLGGMNLYDSLVHTFGTVGTGGFSSYGDSVAHFSSPYLQWVITIFMLLCGINFNLYFVLARRGLKSMIRDSELKLYLLIILSVSALIAINLFRHRRFSRFRRRNSYRSVPSGFYYHDYRLCYC